MKYLFILALFILSSVSSNAQKQWTLEECINYAIDNNINLKQRDIQRQSDEVSLNTSVNSRLPNLQAGVNQNFGFGRSTDREGKTVDRNSSNLGLNLSTSVPVFTGFRITNDIASKRYTLEASTQDLEQAKNDILDYNRSILSSNIDEYSWFALLKSKQTSHPDRSLRRRSWLTLVEQVLRICIKQNQFLPMMKRVLLQRKPIYS
ncbi:hypothetical protein MASR1M31_18030 [Porphyromonadaceae bacterium]